MPTSWTYGKEPVRMALTADAPHSLRPGNKYAGLVQRVLDLEEPLATNGTPTAWSAELNNVSLLPMTARVTKARTRIWAIHKDHKARTPGRSPFIKLSFPEARTLRTAVITVELVESQQGLVVVRAYPGDYMPPIPSMGTAPRAVGGMQACETYWRQHAYLTVPSLVNRITPGTEGAAPDWFVETP